MHLAYVDESGNVGAPGAGGTLTFTLGCVLLDGSRWPDVFDDLIDYRRFLKARFGLPVRAEIKANYILRNGGPFRALKLSERARFAIYRGHIRLHPKLGFSTFAIVIRKDVMLARGLTYDARETAWEYLLQRLERFTTKGNTQVVLVHDEGEGMIVRRAARKARRAGSAGSAFGTGSLKRPARLIIDDPVSRQSHQSYFLQMADLVAYAAFRRVYPPPAPRPGSLQIVPQGMWDNLGAAAFAPANSLSGRPAVGIVAWP
jgi:hypothetical protein